MFGGRCSPSNPQFAKCAICESSDPDAELIFKRFIFARWVLGLYLNWNGLVISCCVDTKDFSPNWLIIPKHANKPTNFSSDPQLRCQHAFWGIPFTWWGQKWEIAIEGYVISVFYYFILFYFFTYQCAKPQELDTVLPQLECGETGSLLCWWEGIQV